MATGIDANLQLDSQYLYDTFTSTEAPFIPQQTVGGGSTIVVSINGTTGNIVLSGGTTGYDYVTSSGTIALAVNNAATVRSSIGAAASGINIDIAQLNGASQVDVSTNYKVAGTQVVQSQGAAVPDATGAGDVVAQLNTLLSRLRAHGLIST